MMKALRFTKPFVGFLLTVLCRHDAQVDSVTYPNSPDSDPPNQWSSMSSNFQQHCSPFGVSIFAKNWPRDKFLHACNVLAQFLDNDNDGCADDIHVVKRIRANQSGMAMFPTENSVNYNQVASNFFAQDLYASETELDCSGSSETSSCRDAAIEEILHVITWKGLGPAYPDFFGECNSNINALSEMQKQMDIARGGHFVNFPSSYPAEAIYHYNDRTCDYSCMATEFIYWAITSLLDGQDARTNQISNEWEANTKAKLQLKLPGMYNLLINNPTRMILLTANGVLPGSNSSNGATGTYKPSSQTCSNGCGLDGTGCGPLGNAGDVESCASSPVAPTMPSPPTAPTPIAPTPTPPTPPSTGELNGEEACEDHGYTRSECLNVGDGSCCHWNENLCWSSIGQEICPGTSSPTAPTPTAPSPTPPTSNFCSDSPFRFKVKINGRNRARDCNWVSKFKGTRCRLTDVSSHCPDTCATCSTCIDARLKFRITLWNGLNRFKLCSYIAKNPDNRCTLDGAKDTCRSTCNNCNNLNPFFT